MSKPRAPKASTTFRQTWARFVLAIAALNLVWEIGQMPLYTLWLTGTRCEIAYAILHCTIGDILIAAFSLAVAVKRHLSDLLRRCGPKTGMARWPFLPWSWPWATPCSRNGGMSKFDRLGPIGTSCQCSPVWGSG